ncbi:MAG: ABC transporter permease [Cyclobacteriaceae bacterium]
MLQAFIRLSFRNLFKKNRFYSLINIVGLAVGLTCLWLVALFVYDEYHFDKHYSNSDRIYRVVVDFSSEGNVTSWAKSSAPIGAYLQQTFPEIEHVVRIRKNPGTDLLSIGESQFYEPSVFFADSTFFSVFDLPFIAGNAPTALKDKRSIVVTKELALKYFGSTDAIGNTIQYDQHLDLKVTGIISEMPATSHFKADAFIPFGNLEELLGEKRLSHWGQFDHYTYVLLKNETSAQALEAKLPELLKQHAPPWVAEKESLHLQPLSSIHLHSDRKDEILPNSNESYSRILGTIAFFILLIAIANFANLSTATFATRNRELTLQKVMGASPFMLACYLFAESIFICFGALFISAAFTQLALPFFNLSTGKALSLLESLWIVLPAFGLTLVLAVITAWFPATQAMSLQALHPNRKPFAAGKSMLRTGLVTFQFATSIFLLFATWVIFEQVDFLKESRYGFESSDVIVVPVKDRSQNDRFATLTQELEQLPGVEAASFSSSTPGANNSLTYTYTISGSASGEQPLSTFIIDEKFLNLYEITLQSGRLIDPHSKDSLADVLLNQAAVDFFQLSDPIGQIVSGKVNGRIVGIVENFNHASLHQAVEPLVLYPFTPSFRFVSIRLNNPAEGLSALEKKWPQLYHGYPLEYAFLNDQIKQLYGSETQVAEAYRFFSVVAILIASVGLIGLSAFLTNRRLKEISIRKVFGGSIRQILVWLYMHYVATIAIASVIASLAGYYLMSLWLSEFSYRVELKPHFFILPPIVMTCVLLLTTGFQSIRAARTNPSKILRED